ncbi:ABA4-like family protein [Tabrizicola sp.]|uniref:ABA4-like family protein n=1 Tax=Tabrizicola sp. TaxID=2005166 RepID=UPI00262D35EE|nr:ABA4-like family protein [Tabrizicola sp.]MDM7930481.1 ABA4-like family protein [Tabrizicola sp.]
MSLDPHTLFQLSGPLAIMGWLALGFAPLAPRFAEALAALVIPLLLSLGYCALILVHWADAPGGFDSLVNVMALFTNPAVALAGWVHYLAFDLLVGAWITRTARAEGISHLLILPCLVLTFLFGPAGFLAFTALRASFAARTRMTKAFA